MNNLLVLFGPALVFGLAAGALVALQPSDPGGVWGGSGLPSIMVGLAVAATVFAASGAFLLGRIVLRVLR